MRIWLIDDDSLTNMIHEAVVKRFDPKVEVEVFNEAQLAMLALENETLPLPDIILLDLNMPVMDGWGFLERYENLCRKVPICVVSSSIDPLEILDVKGFPSVVNYITKPLRVHHLEEVIKESIPNTLPASK